ncbi:MAG: cyclic nucleotide-binding domain-containing protein [Bradymonadia bacterium]
MGMSLMDMMRLQWALVRGRYRGLLVDTEARRQECQALLDSIRGEELGRARYVLDAPLFQHGQLTDDGIIAVLDTQTDRVVGALRATRMSLFVRRPELAPDFQFDADLLGDLTDTAFLCHHLVVTPEHRKTAASLVLMSTVYGLGVVQRGRMCLIDCEPPLARIYRRLGFLPIGQPYTRHGVIFIAMILVNHDAAHLRRVRSPLLRTWRAMGRPRDEAGVAWAAQMKASGHLPSRYFEAVGTSEAIEAQLFDSLSDKGRAEMLQNATRIQLQPGQVVMRQGDIGTWFGVLEAGTLEARVEGRTTAVLHPKDVVGDRACVRRGRRMSDVVAGPSGATLVMLSPGAFKRVKDAEDRAQLWTNVARLLAEQLPGPTCTPVPEPTQPRALDALPLSDQLTPVSVTHPASPLSSSTPTGRDLSTGS